MLKRQRNFNIVRGASCISLFVLASLLISPVASSAVYAEGGKGTVDNAPAELVDMDDADGEIEIYAATTSAVTISFSPSNASGSVTPIDSSTGDKAKVDVQAIVRVQNSGGYSVYAGSTSSQLKNGNSVIDSISAATTYADMPLNRWGYSFRKASSATDKTVTDSYNPMPATVRSSALYTNSNKSITDETTYYMLSFAARIGSDKPAGTYSNSVTFSVVSSPLEITLTETTYDFGGITNMQQMTTAICNAAPLGGVKQLKDIRDNKYYWVGKLADGKCWMTQNLALDLKTNTALTSTTSDVSSNWTPGYNTATSITADTIITDSAGTGSWNLGSYYIKNPNGTTSCGNKKNSLADCTTYFTPLATPTSANGNTNAHYLAGNYYQWCAATAGSCMSGTTAITSGQASSSICPKGWRLPTSGDGGEFQALLNVYGITSGTATSGDTASVVAKPLYFVRGGHVAQETAYLFVGAGANGKYWSSTPALNVTSAVARSLTFSETSSIRPSDLYNGGGRSYGFFVRCIAR